MGRIARSELPDGYFHVVSRSVWGAVLFEDDADRRRFIRLLRRSERASPWTCHAFCLMSTHYHVVVESRRAALSRGLHRLNGRYAREFNLRHGRYGHVFADRFTARAIEGEEYLYDACSYVLLNPVKAALCDRPDQWPWSYSRFELDAA